MGTLFAWADRSSRYILGSILVFVSISGFHSCDVLDRSINCAAYVAGAVTGSVFRMFGMALIVLAIARRIGMIISLDHVMGALIPAFLIMEIAFVTSFVSDHILIKVMLLTVAGALLVIGIERLIKRGIRQAVGTAVLVVCITAMIWFTIFRISL